MPTAERAKPEAKRAAKRRGSSARLARAFYAGAVDAAQRIELEEAAGLEGLDEEIALLRVKLREAVEKRPEDLALMLRGIDMLVKAVATRYKMSKPATEDLADSIAGVIKGVGVQLMPERFADV
jgi:hypothetical protein